MTEGRSHVEVAERAGNREIARLLLDAGARPVELGPVERFVAACLHADRAEVASTRTDELVRVLVERGADPTIRDARFDGTPEGWAAYAGQDDVVRYLGSLGP